MSSESAYATAPFDHERADIILRSSDNINFRVFKLFLSLASPVFKTLFDIPQPAQASDDQEIKDGLAVISVTEDSKTLDTLLRFCYPCTLADDPKLDILHDVLDILTAAKKYSLDAIDLKARQAITNPKILEVESLRCFAIAHREGSREETLLAAKYTLTQPLIPSWFKEIELIGATDLLSLLTYHWKCGEAVYALKLDLSWITSHYRSAGACRWLSGQSHSVTRHSLNQMTSCRCSMSAPRYKLFSHSGILWWENFMEEAFVELRDRPCRATVQELADKTVQSVKAEGCSVCSPEGTRDFVALFESKIEEKVSKIELELNF